MPWMRGCVADIGAMAWQPVTSPNERLDLGEEILGKANRRTVSSSGSGDMQTDPAKRAQIGDDVGSSETDLARSFGNRSAVGLHDDWRGVFAFPVERSAGGSRQGPGLVKDDRTSSCRGQSTPLLDDCREPL